MINSYQEFALLPLEHRLVSAAIILPYMGDVVAGSDCYSFCGGVKQMQKATKVVHIAIKKFREKIN